MSAGVSNIYDLDHKNLNNIYLDFLFWLDY